jgi:hypothetical protein
LPEFAAGVKVSSTRSARNREVPLFLLLFTGKYQRGIISRRRNPQSPAAWRSK